MSSVRGMGVAVITSTSAPRRAALGLQREPLMHAEAVLLVDDGEGEILEGDIGSWNSACVPTRMSISPAASRSSSALRSALLAAGEQRNAQARLREGRDGLGVLAREHLGRRHQRRLRARLDGRGHRQQRDHGLAGADVALQQPQHAVGRGHVGVDLGDGAGLRGGERERQRRHELRADAAVARDRAAALRLEALAHDGERELAGEQLVEGEPLPGGGRGRDIGRILGPVQAAQRSAKLGQPRASRQRGSCHSGKSGTRSSAWRAAFCKTLPERPAVRP